MSKEKNIILGVTGHRTLSHEVQKIKKKLDSVYIEKNVGAVVTGMACGFDMLVAESCLENSIPFVAAVPFIGQESIWSQVDKDRYLFLLSKAWKTKIVSKGGYQNWKFLERNKWIVSRSNTMVSYWNGHKSGGTYHCLTHAKASGIACENIF